VPFKRTLKDQRNLRFFGRTRYCKNKTFPAKICLKQQNRAMFVAFFVGRGCRSLTANRVTSCGVPEFLRRTTSSVVTKMSRIQLRDGEHTKKHCRRAAGKETPRLKATCLVFQQRRYRLIALGVWPIGEKTGARGVDMHSYREGKFGFCSGHRRLCIRIADTKRLTRIRPRRASRLRENFNRSLKI